MVNRTMQAKSLKMKRMKRLFPRRLSADYIPVGMPPNRLVMAQYKESAKSLAFDQKYMDWLETIARFRGKPPGKLEAEKAWERIKDACPNLMNVVLEASQVRNVKMFYNSERTQFILLEENYVGRFVRASIRYQDRDRCIARFKSSQVRWVEFVSSSPPKP